MSDQDWAIHLTNVDKMYKGKVHALRGIEMLVRRGEVFGLLGPNGAGKSTLVKILLTVISATRAQGTMLGMPIGHKPTLARVGYLPEHHRFPEYLTGGQVLDFYGAMGGIAKAERRARAAQLLDLVGMTAWKDHRVKGYSKGMRQRIGIAQALMNDPELVVLDEPTDGVDPVGRRDIRNLVAHLKQQGKTVFLNSHLLSELEMVCDRVAILVQGRVATQGTIGELTRYRQYYDIEVCPLPSGDAAALTGQMLRALPQAVSGVLAPPLPGTSSSMTQSGITHKGTLPGGEFVELGAASVRVGTERPEVIAPMVQGLLAHGMLIRGIRLVRPTLEDLFMEAVTDPTTGQALKPGADRSKGKP